MRALEWFLNEISLIANRLQAHVKHAERLFATFKWKRKCNFSPIICFANTNRIHFWINFQVYNEEFWKKEEMKFLVVFLKLSDDVMRSRWRRLFPWQRLETYLIDNMLTSFPRCPSDEKFFVQIHRNNNHDADTRNGNVYLTTLYLHPGTTLNALQFASTSITGVPLYRKEESIYQW